MVFSGRLRSVIAHVDGAGVETFHKVRIRRLARAANRLSDLDYVVFSAADAIQAADCIATNAPIDLILSDVALPGGVNGPEFVEGLRSRYPEVPVVFMTGYAPMPACCLSMVARVFSCFANHSVARNWPPHCSRRAPLPVASDYQP